jgi:hypothetical protein
VRCHTVTLPEVLNTPSERTTLLVEQKLAALA